MKYEIQYSTGRRGANNIQEFETDDPVACEDFLVTLLEQKMKIHQILHDGVPLTPHAFDKMIKSAAGILAQEHVCQSLDVDSVEAHYRFGVPA